MKSCSDATRILSYKSNRRVIYGDFSGKHSTRADETVHFIYAHVTAWQYGVSQPTLRKASSKASLCIRIEATIEAAAIFNEPIPVNICLISESHDTDTSQLSPWQLDVLPPQNDPLIPRFSETVITLTETTLRDVKDGLFLTVHSPELSVQVGLTLRETAVPFSDVAERSFEILELNYTLRSQKDNQ